MTERFDYNDDIDYFDKIEKKLEFIKYKYPFDFSKDVVKKDNKAVDDKVEAPKTSPVSEKEVDMGGADNSGENASSKESRLDKQAKRQSIYEHRVAQAERLLSKLEQI